MTIAVNNDAKKAFQNFDRDAIWRALETRFPEIANLVRLQYGTPSSILLQDAGLGDPVIVLNAVGARQGCTFGTLLYALVQHPILIEVAEQYEDLTILAFADDANFLSECVV